MVVATAISRFATTMLTINLDNDKKPITMTIDPELFRLIQVEGITDEDYRRVQPKIEAVKQMAALTSEGVFIFDLFKMEFYYIAPNPLGWNGKNAHEIKGMGMNFLEEHFSQEQQKLIHQFTAYMQNFNRQLTPDTRHDYVAHCNYAKIGLPTKKMLNTRSIPLEFAADGRAWLVLKVITTAPDDHNTTFAIQNIKTNEVRIYDTRSNTWSIKDLKPLSTTEKSVLTLMAQGKSVKSIAMELHKSEDTIRSHQKALFKKLDAHTAIEAIGTAKKYRMM